MSAAKSTTSKTSSPFSNLQVLQKLQSSNFDVYLAKNQSTNQPFVLKVFPSESQDILNPSYTIEKLFTNLNHPNIIKYLGCVDNQVASKKGVQINTSVLYMEAAPYGDLTSFISNSYYAADEQLIRSIFHQIVSGVAYLHSKELAHMDMKCDNVLIGENFEVKICDFW